MPGLSQRPMANPFHLLPASVSLALRCNAAAEGPGTGWVSKFFQLVPGPVPFPRELPRETRGRHLCMHATAQPEAVVT